MMPGAVDAERQSGAGGILHGMRDSDRLLVLVLALIAGTGCGDESKADNIDRPVACTDDQMVGPDGQRYGRDPSQGCKFVDDDGDVVPGQ